MGNLIRTGPLELAVPVINPEQWCHAECYQRWASLDESTQGIVGGHIHYDESNQTWRVLFPVELRTVGVLSEAGVARRG